MFKTLLFSIAIAVAVVALQAQAEPRAEHDLSILPADVAARVVQLQGYGDRYEAAIEAVFVEWSKPSANAGRHELDLSILPSEVAAQVVALQHHGDRFEKAIRGIYVEAIKPSWGFDDCSHDAKVAMPPS